MKQINQKIAWKNLEEHYRMLSNEHMRNMFNNDPDRFDKFRIEFNDILLDYSKNRISEKTLPLLIDLAKDADLAVWIEKMFAGE